MLSNEMFRALVDEREREIEANVRIERLLALSRPAVRWHHREAKPSSRRAGAIRTP
jgi:hypothetical protein